MGQPGEDDQAVALRVLGDRCAFYNCKILGYHENTTSCTLPVWKAYNINNLGFSPISTQNINKLSVCGCHELKFKMCI